MEIKISLFQEKGYGMPVTELSSGVLTTESVVDSLSNGSLSEAILSLLKELEVYLEDVSVITLLENSPIQRAIDLSSLQFYLRTLGLRLVVGVTSGAAAASQDSHDVKIVALVPVGEAIPSMSEFSGFQGELLVEDVVKSIVSEYNIDNLGVVPLSDLRNMLTGIDQIRSKGLPVGQVYYDSLLNSLANRGLDLIYVLN